MGRSKASGPFSGAYLTIPLGTIDVTNAANDTILAAAPVPCDCRLQAFGWHLPAAASNPAVLAVAKSATSVIGGTALLSATIDLEVATEGLALAADTTPTLTTTSADRDIDQGEFIVMELDGAGTGDIVRGTFYALVSVRDHANVNASDD